MVLLRRHIGGVLRDWRTDRNLTLLEVAAPARVSKGYLSEVERGVKEPSSEVLHAVAMAMNVRLSDIINEVGMRLAISESMEYDMLAGVPDTVPAELVDEFNGQLV